MTDFYGKIKTRFSVKLSYPPNPHDLLLLLKVFKEYHYEI